MTPPQFRSESRRTAVALAIVGALWMSAANPALSDEVGDLVYCDRDEDGVYDPSVGDFPLDGVDVRVVCTDAEGTVCVDTVATTGVVHESLDSLANHAQRCADSLTYDPLTDFSGRYLVEVLGVAGAGCRFPVDLPSPYTCTMELDFETLPQKCDGLVTPLAGGPPFDGNDDGDFCDPEDGPFPEDQILGDSGIDQQNCERTASPAPVDGVHTAIVAGGLSRCSLYGDFGVSKEPAICELSVEKSAEPNKIVKRVGKWKKWLRKHKHQSGSGSSCPPGHEVTYTYVVSNDGTELSDLLIVDDQLGEIASLESLAPGASEVFSATACIKQTTTNTVLAEGLLANADLCSASASVEVEVVKPKKKKKKRKHWGWRH